MRALFCFLIPLVLVSFAHAEVSETAIGLKFIVHKDNPVAVLTKKEIADYFLKTKREWPGGKMIRFIDRKPGPERKIFFEKVLRKTEEEVDRFWIGQKLYSGDSAPVQSASDRMSMQFVSSFEGAIGYISGATEVTHKSVKELKVAE